MGNACGKLAHCGQFFTAAQVAQKLALFRGFPNVHNKPGAQAPAFNKRVQAQIKGKAPGQFHFMRAYFVCVRCLRGHPHAFQEYGKQGLEDLRTALADPARTYKVMPFVRAVIAGVYAAVMASAVPAAAATTGDCF